MFTFKWNKGWDGREPYCGVSKLEYGLGKNEVAGGAFGNATPVTVKLAG